MRLHGVFVVISVDAIQIKNRVYTKDHLVPASRQQARREKKSAKRLRRR